MSLGLTLAVHCKHAIHYILLVTQRRTMAYINSAGRAMSKMGRLGSAVNRQQNGDGTVTAAGCFGPACCWYPSNISPVSCQLAGLHHSGYQAAVVTAAERPSLTRQTSASAVVQTTSRPKRLVVGLRARTLTKPIAVDVKSITTADRTTSHPVSARLRALNGKGKDKTTDAGSDPVVPPFRANRSATLIAPVRTTGSCVVTIQR